MILENVSDCALYMQSCSVKGTLQLEMFTQELTYCNSSDVSTASCVFFIGMTVFFSLTVIDTIVY